MQCSSEATEETDKYITTEVYILLYAENIPFLHVPGRDADFYIKEYLLAQLLEMFPLSQTHLFFFFNSSNSQPYIASLWGKGDSTSPLPMPCICCCLPLRYPCFPISLWSSTPLPARDLIPHSASRGSGLRQYESTSADPIKYQRLGGLNNGNIFLSFGGWRVQNQVPEDFGVWWGLCLFLDGYLLPHMASPWCLGGKISLFLSL